MPTMGQGLAGSDGSVAVAVVVDGSVDDLPTTQSPSLPQRQS